MNSVKQILVILVFLFLYATVVVAQERQPALPSRNPVEVTIIIQQQQLRFSAPASAQEIRLEVFNKNGESVYDSGLASGPEISWGLQNANGEAIPSGLYAYSLTVKEAGSETPATRRGHLILESGRDRLWVTSQGAIGAEESPSGGELTASSGSETNVVGARIGRGLASKGSPINLDLFGTPGRIPMFTGSDSLDDSVISQDFNGRIGIGTQRPGAALLTVAGQIETTSGGIKFPNGTVQTTSAAGALTQVIHNATLTGNGTGDAPLGVAVPLNLVGSSGGPIVEITNNGNGFGVRAKAFDVGVVATGGDDPGFPGDGVEAKGGNGSSSSGTGVIARGGNSSNSGGGIGVHAFGGAGVVGGYGIWAQAGSGGNGNVWSGRFDSGNIAVTLTGGGLILTSPDGKTCRLLSIDNTGAIVLTNVTCTVITTQQ